MSDDQHHLSAIVERITFHNEENGFSVLKVKVAKRQALVCVVGSALGVQPGVTIRCVGHWHVDRQYGQQFKADEIAIVPPQTLEGVEKYLGSGLIPGIGSHFAKRLVRAFGLSVFEIIEHQPNRLLDLEGIGKKRAQQLQSSWIEQKKIKDIMVFLQSHGIGTARAVRIYKMYGDSAVVQIQTDPYCLARDIPGVGFKTADFLAVKLGLPLDSPNRLRAGVAHVLHDSLKQGHCYLKAPKLTRAAALLLDQPEAAVTVILNESIASSDVIVETFEDEICVYLPHAHGTEEALAKRILSLQAGQPIWRDVPIDEALSWVESDQGIALSFSQQTAFREAIKHKFMIITGGPGVGKTTLVNSILKVLQRSRVKIALTAPTGRAAKRLAESTGFPAKTIHRLLAFDPQKKGFRFDQNDPLDLDLLVVDETSMVDLYLMHQLTRALPDHAAMLWIGDVDQLPSVGPGSVLKDVIASGVVKTVSLTEIFRQAKHSKIITNAHRINQGKMPIQPGPEEGISDFYYIRVDSVEQIPGKIRQLVQKRIPDRFGFDPKKDIQVLTPMHRGPAGSRALNVDLQAVLNPSAQENGILRFGWRYGVGDKVMQLVNDYDKEVFNGDMGLIERIDTEEGLVTVGFDGRRVLYGVGELDALTLAYAVSIHKSQGSEYPAVVIPLAMQHFMLLERNLLYTAVTRGRSLVILVGEVKALAMAVKRVHSMQRNTGLAARLAMSISQQDDLLA
jgi:exodeoxyribonuclease V alpha subunit